MLSTLSQTAVPVAPVAAHRPAPESLHHAVWRAHQLGSKAAGDTLSSGFATLDAQLPGGGWPRSALTELLITEPGIGELQLLAGVLAAQSRAGKSILFIAPPAPLNALALSQWGLDLRQVLLLAAPRPADRLWAIEQALKSGSVGALLAWLPTDSPTRVEHLRRLQLAAQHSTGLAFLYRPLAARQQASPAPLRLTLAAAPERQLAVQLIKRRGPVHAQPLLLTLPRLTQRMVFRVLEPAAKTRVADQVAL